MSADTIAIITTVITVGILLFGATATMFQMQYKRMDSIDNRIGSLENRITAFEQRVENRLSPSRPGSPHWSSGKLVLRA